jgi:hypothetical protein
MTGEIPSEELLVQERGFWKDIERSDKWAARCTRIVEAGCFLAGAVGLAALLSGDYGSGVPITIIGFGGGMAAHHEADSDRELQQDAVDRLAGVEHQLQKLYPSAD